METSKKYRFGVGDAYHFMMWANEAYPEVFKEWVSVRAIEPDDKIYDIKETTWD